MLQHDLPNNEFTTRFYDDGRVIASQVPENRRQWHYSVRAGSDFMSGSNTFSVSGIYDLETHIDRAQVPFEAEGPKVPTYSSERVSTFTTSPSLMWNGT